MPKDIQRVADAAKMAGFQNQVDEVGATKAYKDLMGKAGGVGALVGGGKSLDLDEYVTNKALDGLFATVAAEGKNIRTNPAARTTDLLKTVFGK